MRVLIVPSARKTGIVGASRGDAATPGGDPDRTRAGGLALLRQAGSPQRAMPDAAPLATKARDCLVRNR